MTKTGEIYDYSSFVFYKKNINPNKKDKIIRSNDIIDNYNNYSNIIKNIGTAVNKPQFKENNFFF